MKKLTAVLLALAMLLTLAAAGADPITAADVTDQYLAQATTPRQLLKDGAFSITAAVRGDAGGQKLVIACAMNGEYVQWSQTAYASDGSTVHYFFTDDPADGLVYASASNGQAMIQELDEELILYYIELSQMGYYDSFSIEDAAEADGKITVTVHPDASVTDVVTLEAATGRVLTVESVRLAEEEGGEPVAVLYEFDYSDSVAVDLTAVEANAGKTLEDLKLPAQVSIETTDLYGQPVTDELIRDAKLVMLNLWEPWCGPCVGEMPDLQRLYEKYSDQGFIILGVYGYFDYDEEAKSLVEEKGITYPILRMSSELSRLQQDYVPATFFLDSSGNLLTSEPFAGSNSYEGWEALILEYLNR